MIEIKEKYIEKAVFVGVIKQGDDERQVLEYLDELEFLAETAGAEGTKRFIQKVDKPDSRTYIRSGKLEEIKAYIAENETDVVIFDAPYKDVDTPRKAEGRHRNERSWRDTDRDRQANHPGQDSQAERAAEENRQTDGLAAREQGFPGAHFTRRIHKCREKHTNEPACKKRRVCREQAVRDA